MSVNSRPSFSPLRASWGCCHRRRPWFNANDILAGRAPRMIAVAHRRLPADLDLRNSACERSRRTATRLRRLSWRTLRCSGDRFRLKLVKRLSAISR